MTTKDFDQSSTLPLPSPSPLRSASPAGLAKRLGYQPGLDALRAVAITAVVLFHIYYWPLGGWLGVDLFFVLSGFLITTLLLEEWRAHGSVSLWLFYQRRVLRLFPALWVLLLISVPVFWLDEHDLRAVLPGAVYGITYTTNIAYALHQDIDRFEHLWSLALEEQFYLLWPVALLLTLRTRRPIRTAATLAVVTAALIALARFGVSPYSELAAGRFRLDSILVGCAAAVMYSSRGKQLLRRIATSAAILPAVIGAMAAIVVLARPRQIPYGITLLFSLCTVVLLIAAIDDPSDGQMLRRTRSLFTKAPIVFLGRISYALYLWHWVIRAWTIHAQLPERMGAGASRTVALIASLAAATLSYYIVEKPFLRRKWRLARTPTHDAAV